jgi:hypothetical protein
MADLTATSGEWWEKLLKECRQWYQDHMALSPLDRLAHEPKPSKELEQPRWTRLERRASTLLMMSIPEAQKEELVSTKRITAMKILCHLFTTFQPGGLAEKEVILRSLESPAEAATVADAVSALRKWMRWRRRAMELQVSEPDPFLLLKGLGRIVKKPLEGNRELNFRVSLARSTLQVDSTPTRDTVGKFATHLLAEMEQIAHLDNNKKSIAKDTAKAAQPDAKLKKIEEHSAEGKGWRAEKGNTPCKFFLTEEGCRKGQQCAWKHQVEGDTRRCWACGATDHYANKCPRPKKERSSEEGWKKGAKGEGKSLQKTTKEKDEAPLAAAGSSDPMPKDGRNEEDSQAVRGLLEEANKMLKALKQGKAEEPEDKDVRLKKLQDQLDELKSMKVFRTAKVHAEGEDCGLLDSGATP